MLKEFIDARTKMWRRLEELVDAVRLNRLTHLSRDEVPEPPPVSPATATTVREETPRPSVTAGLFGVVFTQAPIAMTSGASWAGAAFGKSGRVPSTEGVRVQRPVPSSSPLARPSIRVIGSTLVVRIEKARL